MAGTISNHITTDLALPSTSQTPPLRVVASSPYPRGAKRVRRSIVGRGLAPGIGSWGLDTVRCVLFVKTAACVGRDDGAARRKRLRSPWIRGAVSEAD